MPAGLHVTTATMNFIHRLENYTYNGLNDFEHSETTASIKQAQRHPKLLNTTLLCQCLMAVKFCLAPFNIFNNIHHYLGGWPDAPNKSNSTMLKAVEWKW